MENRRDSGDDVLRDACRRARVCCRRPITRRSRRVCRTGRRPARSCWASTCKAAPNVMLEVDKPSVLHTLAMNLRDDVRRILREEKVAITGGIGQTGARRADAHRRTPPTAQRSSPSCKRPEPPGYTNRLGGLAAARGRRRGRRAHARQRDRRRPHRKGPPRRRSVDRGRSAAASTRSARSEPSIQRQGDDRIIVQVPGLQDPRAVEDDPRPDREARIPSRRRPRPSPAETEELEQTDQPGKIQHREAGHGAGRGSHRRAAGFDQRGGEPVVNFRFNIRGAQKFGEVTSKNVGRLFAIVLDNKVISAPRILTPITGGSGQISGHFTVEQANNLVDPAARRRPAGQAQHRRGAHGRPGPRPGFDRRRQARRLCRRRARGLSTC